MATNLSCSLTRLAAGAEETGAVKAVGAVGMEAAGGGVAVVSNPVGTRLVNWQATRAAATITLITIKETLFFISLYLQLTQLSIAGSFFQQGFLLGRQLPRDLHFDLHVQVAF